MEIRLGLRTLAVDDFATLLQDALPELMTLDKAKQAASELVENASRRRPSTTVRGPEMSMMSTPKRVDELDDEAVMVC